MRIGILGSGLMGAKLGTMFARTGHQVVVLRCKTSLVDALERAVHEHQ